MQIKGVVVIIFCAVLSAIISLFYNYTNLLYSVNWWWSLTFFFVLFTVINIVYQQNLKPDSDGEAMRGIVWLKLILLFAGIITYSLVDKMGLALFSAHFFTHYILFTVFEIRYLLSITRKPKT